MGASFQLEFYSWEEIMIAKITLVSMLAAVALARPEADPYFYHHGVVGHVHPTCEQGVDTLAVQTCAPRVEKVCNTNDVVSEEIEYKKRCINVVNKHCSSPLSSALPRPNLRLKLILNTGAMAMLLLMLLLFPKSKPRPSKHPALNIPLNIALMFPKPKQLSLPLRLAMMLLRLTVLPLITPLPK